MFGGPLAPAASRKAWTFSAPFGPAFQNCPGTDEFGHLVVGRVASFPESGPDRPAIEGRDASLGRRARRLHTRSRGCIEIGDRSRLHRRRGHRSLLRRRSFTEGRLEHLRRRDGVTEQARAGQILLRLASILLQPSRDLFARRQVALVVEDQPLCQRRRLAAKHVALVQQLGNGTPGGASAHHGSRRVHQVRRDIVFGIDDAFARGLSHFHPCAGRIGHSAGQTANVRIGRIERPRDKLPIAVSARGHRRLQPPYPGLREVPRGVQHAAALGSRHLG